MNALKDVLVRAGWTAAQTLLAQVLVVGLANVGNLAFWKQAAVAAAAAGLSALKTFISQQAGGATRGAEDQLAAEGRTVEAPKE